MLEFIICAAHFTLIYLPVAHPVQEYCNGAITDVSLKWRNLAWCPAIVLEVLPRGSVFIYACVQNLIIYKFLYLHITLLH